MRIAQIKEEIFRDIDAPRYVARSYYDPECNVELWRLTRLPLRKISVVCTLDEIVFVAELDD